MSHHSDIRDFRNPNVALDDERLAADAALDAYIEAAPSAEASVAYLLKDSYLRLLTTSRAQELQWLGVLERCLGCVCEKRRQNVDGRIMRKALTAVHKLDKPLFSRYARVALHLYSRTLIHARKLEIANALAQFHDCVGLSVVVAKIGNKFQALQDALERRLELGNCHHGADCTTKQTKEA